MPPFPPEGMPFSTTCRFFHYREYPEVLLSLQPMRPAAMVRPSIAFLSPFSSSLSCSLPFLAKTVSAIYSFLIRGRARGVSGSLRRDPPSDVEGSLFFPTGAFALCEFQRPPAAAFDETEFRPWLSSIARRRQLFQLCFRTDSFPSARLGQLPFRTGKPSSLYLSGFVVKQSRYPPLRARWSVHAEKGSALFSANSLVVDPDTVHFACLVHRISSQPTVLERFPSLS